MSTTLSATQNKTQKHEHSHPIWYNELQKKGSITNRVGCVLILHQFGAGA